MLGNIHVLPKDTVVIDGNRFTTTGAAIPIHRDEYWLLEHPCLGTRCYLDTGFISIKQQGCGKVTTLHSVILPHIP